MHAFQPARAAPVCTPPCIHACLLGSPLLLLELNVSGTADWGCVRTGPNNTTNDRGVCTADARTTHTRHAHRRHPPAAIMQLTRLPPPIYFLTPYATGSGWPFTARSPLFLVIPPARGVLSARPFVHHHHHGSRGTTMILCPVHQSHTTPPLTQCKPPAPCFGLATTPRNPDAPGPRGHHAWAAQRHHHHHGLPPARHQRGARPPPRHRRLQGLCWQPDGAADDGGGEEVPGGAGPARGEHVERREPLHRVVRLPALGEGPEGGARGRQDPQGPCFPAPWFVLVCFGLVLVWVGFGLVWWSID
jgi:hypothetical protein